MFTRCHLGLACSIALHAGLLAWVLWPAAQRVPLPLQQVVDIEVVRVSAPAPVEQANAEPQPPTPAEPKPVQQAKSDLQKVVQANPRPHASTPPTTGPQSPRAVAQLAAITQPVFDAVSLHNIPPAYPESARSRGIEGNVTLEVAVATDGLASAVDIIRSSGYSILDRAAHDAIGRWRFIPARRGDAIVEAKVVVPVEFRLE